MKFEEAVKQAELGKKIRNVTWDKDKFIYLDTYYDNLIWYNHHRFDALFPNDVIPFPLYCEIITPWEIYVKETEIEIELELINFQEALKAFKEGKTIKRYKYSSMFTRGRLFTTELVFSCEDVFADDWIIIG